MNLHEKFVKLGRERNRITYQLLALLPEIYRLRIYREKGYPTIEEYAGKLAGLSGEVVKKALKLGQKLEDKPCLQKAIETQGIHKVAIVANLATPETDKVWADKVENMSKASLQELSREVRGKTANIKIELDDEMQFMFLKLKKQMGLSSNQEVLRKLLRMTTQQKPQKVTKIPGGKRDNSPKPCSRHIPRDKQRELSDKCTWPNCNKPAEVIHHHNPFSESHSNKEPLKNTITMQKQSFLSATLLDLLDLSYLIGLRRSASQQTKITDFIKRDGVFQRFHNSIVTLCKEHHEFAHNDITNNGKLNLAGELKQADRLYRKYRQVALL